MQSPRQSFADPYGPAPRSAHAFQPAFPLKGRSGGGSSTEAGEHDLFRLTPDDNRRNAPSAGA
jgi:hypothetical protein